MLVPSNLQSDFRHIRCLEIKILIHPATRLTSSFKFLAQCRCQRSRALPKCLSSVMYAAKRLSTAILPYAKPLMAKFAVWRTSRMRLDFARTLIIQCLILSPGLSIATSATCPKLWICVLIAKWRRTAISKRQKIPSMRPSYAVGTISMIMKNPKVATSRHGITKRE